MNSAEVTLLPCPFCGERDKKLVQASTRVAADLVLWSVECECGASIDSPRGREQADLAWNTRATVPPPESEREVSTNKDETIAKLLSAVEAALNWIDQDDCSQMGPAEDAAHTRMIRRLEEALTSTEKEGRDGARR